MIIMLPAFKGTHKGWMYLFFQLFFMVLSIVVMLLTLNSPNFIASVFSPQEYGVTLSLLKTYNLVYKILIGGFFFNIVLLLGGCSFCLWKICSQKLAATFGAFFYTMLIMAFGIFLSFFMIYSEDVFSLLEQSSQDIQQVESNTLSIMTVGFSKRSYESSMPGPYNSSVEMPVMRYGITDMTSDEPTGWVDMFIPHGLNFKIANDECYSEGKSIQENRMNAQLFKISYTDNFMLVVDIERIPK